MSLVRRIARPLLASIFITEGIDTLRHPDMRVARAEPALEKVEQMAEPLGVSIDAQTAVRINGAVMTVAGGLLAMGKVPRAAATVLSVSLAATTVVGHPFWAFKDAENRRTHRKAFARNLVFLGGLLHAAVDTDGKPSLAWRRQHRKEVRAKNDD